MDAIDPTRDIGTEMESAVGIIDVEVADAVNGLSESEFMSLLDEFADWDEQPPPPVAVCASEPHTIDDCVTIAALMCKTNMCAYLRLTMVSRTMRRAGQIVYETREDLRQSIERYFCVRVVAPLVYDEEVVGFCFRRTSDALASLEIAVEVAQSDAHGGVYKSATGQRRQRKYVLCEGNKCWEYDVATTTAPRRMGARGVVGGRHKSFRVVNKRLKGFRASKYPLHGLTMRKIDGKIIKNWDVPLSKNIEDGIASLRRSLNACDSAVVRGAN